MPQRAAVVLDAEEVEEERPCTAAGAARGALRPTERITHQGYPGVGRGLDGVGCGSGNPAQAALHTRIGLELEVPRVALQAWRIHQTVKPQSWHSHEALTALTR